MPGTGQVKYGERKYSTFKYAQLWAELLTRISGVVMRGVKFIQ